MYTVPILIGISIFSSFGFIITIVDNYFLKRQNDELKNKLKL